MDASGALDMDWWRRESEGVNWADVLSGGDTENESSLRRSTYSGRPFGSDSFVNEMSQRFGRYWTRGRPKKENPTTLEAPAAGQQLSMFAGSE